MAKACEVVNDKNIVAFMGQPSTLKYFKKLVYYVISLVVTLNKMIEAEWARRARLRRSDYSRTGELMNNVIDQLFFLQDVLNIQVEAVNEYLKRLMMEDFFLRYCYDVITRAGGQALISLRTSLFLLTATINTMKEISFPSSSRLLNPTPTCRSTCSRYCSPSPIISSNRTLFLRSQHLSQPMRPPRCTTARTLPSPRADSAVASWVASTCRRRRRRRRSPSPSSPCWSPSVVLLICRPRPCPPRRATRPERRRSRK